VPGGGGIEVRTRVETRRTPPTAKVMFVVLVVTTVGGFVA
jgi:hypothetical protein